MNTSQQRHDVFSQRLKQARLAKGLSQKKLGIAAGIDEFVASTRINRYEKGVASIPLSSSQTHLMSHWHSSIPQMANWLN